MCMYYLIVIEVMEGDTSADSRTQVLVTVGRSDRSISACYYS